MPYNDKDYDGESGLLTDYTGTIIDAWFQANDRFGGTQLCLKQSTDNPLTPEWTENFNIGGQWETLDGGLTVENTVNPDKTAFNKNSRVSKLFDAVTLLGVRSVFKERDVSPQEAKGWVGLKFKWTEHSEGQRTIIDRETQESRVVNPSYNLPTEYLGVDEAVAAGGGAAAASTPSNPAAAATSSLEGLDDDLVTALRDARSASTSHHDFVDKAVALTGVAGNTTLITAIADEDKLYKELG